MSSAKIKRPSSRFGSASAVFENKIRRNEPIVASHDGLKKLRNNTTETRKGFQNLKRVIHGQYPPKPQVAKLSTADSDEEEASYYEEEILSASSGESWDEETVDEEEYSVEELLEGEIEVPANSSDVYASAPALVMVSPSTPSFVSPTSVIDIFNISALLSPPSTTCTKTHGASSKPDYLLFSSNEASLSPAGEDHDLCKSALSENEDHLLRGSATRIQALARCFLVRTRLRKTLDQRLKILAVYKKLEATKQDTQRQLQEERRRFEQKRESCRNEHVSELENAKNMRKSFKTGMASTKTTIREMRSENRGLREKISRLGRKIAKVRTSSEDCIKSNDEITDHLRTLGNFATKAKRDRNLLEVNHSKIKEEFLPSHRRALREQEQYISAESKMGLMYKHYLLRISKHILRKKEIVLGREIDSILRDCEKGTNRRFDPTSRGFEEDDSSSSEDSRSTDDSDDESVSSCSFC